MVTIRPMLEEDIRAVSIVHGETFRRQLSSKKWITCNFNAYPRMMIFVAVTETNQIVGFIQWLHKSGFRRETVIEVDQIAVLADFQGKNIGTQLILKSLEQVKEYVLKHDSVLKAIMVTTRSDNNIAKRLYEKTLGAKVNACIENLYSGDEVIMLAQYI